MKPVTLQMRKPQKRKGPAWEVTSWRQSPGGPRSRLPAPWPSKRSNPNPTPKRCRKPVRSHSSPRVVGTLASCRVGLRLQQGFGLFKLPSAESPLSCPPQSPASPQFSGYPSSECPVMAPGPSHGQHAVPVLLLPLMLPPL